MYNQILVSVSGGKDSVAMALRLHELGYKFTILSIVTEFEFPAVEKQVLKVIEITGMPYNIVKTPKGVWDKWFYGKITRGNLKGKVRGVRFCARVPYCWYKREAKYKVFERIDKSFKTVCIGIRYDEKRRAGGEYKYPLVEWKWAKSDVKKYLKEKGCWIKEYDIFSHTGCYLCPYQSKKSWLSLKLYYPSLFKTALKYHCDNMKLVGIPIIPNEILTQSVL